MVILGGKYVNELLRGNFIFTSTFIKVSNEFTVWHCLPSIS